MARNGLHSSAARFFAAITKLIRQVEGDFHAQDHESIELYVKPPPGSVADRAGKLRNARTPAPEHSRPFAAP
jgi:hypothetical protein